MTKLIIFDMDGVLIDSEPLYRKVNTKLFRELGVEMQNEEYNGYIGIAADKMWKSIKKNHKLKQPVKKLMELEKEKKHDALKGKKLRSMPGVKALLNKLMKNGLKMCVASSSAEKNIKLILTKTGLKDYFDKVSSGEGIKNGKPAPDIFLKAAGRMKPEDCFVIEDSANGVFAAKRAGMKCIGIKDPDSGNQDLSKADITVNDFKKDNINKILTFITYNTINTMS
jgi:HAD superfamily hydrolase (TIGR01509 family)